MNNLSLVNIFGETGRFFYNINYVLNSEHLSLVNKIGDKSEFTITRVHCTKKFCNLEVRIQNSFVDDFIKQNVCVLIVNSSSPEVVLGVQKREQNER